MEQEDRISNLPTIILHNIISRLWEESEKDATRISVLSKTWLETWYTFPILSFHDSRFVEQSIQPRKNENFIEYVKRTLFRFWVQSLAIKEFRLELELPYMSNDVDLCLKLVSESSVEVLTLCLRDGDKGLGECYVLPKGVIEIKSLTKLELEGGIRVDQAFMNNSIKFFSLRELYLSDVLLEDERVIEHLISCCPLLEFITLNFSKGVMKSLRIHDLQKLKTVDVENIKEVYIDEASSLVTLHYFFDKYLNTRFKIDFIQCRNLKKLLLSLERAILTDNWFLELFKKFPFLDTLEIWNCKMSKKINISSIRLKSFDLLSCSNLKEVNIDAPNLLLEIFISNKFLFDTRLISDYLGSS